MARKDFTMQQLLNPMILQDEYLAIDNGLKYSMTAKNGNRILINCGIRNSIITYSYLEIMNSTIIHQMRESRLEDFDYSNFQYDASPYRVLYP